MCRATHCYCSSIRGYRVQIIFFGIDVKIHGPLTPKVIQQEAVVTNIRVIIPIWHRIYVNLRKMWSQSVESVLLKYDRSMIRLI